MFDRLNERAECSAEEPPCLLRQSEHSSKILKFDQGQTLFKAGEKRTLAYRVIKGGFCHYAKWPDGQHLVIEFVYAGDIIGFGHYKTYLTTAKALQESEVVEVTETEFNQALSEDPTLDARLSATADREFEIIRQRSIGSKPRPPLQRLASYLSAMAQLGCSSGGSDVQIPQKEGLKVLASLLEIGSSEIRSALANLKKRGLITETSNCIIVKDQKALDQFADAIL